MSTCPYCGCSETRVEYQLEWKDNRFPEYSVTTCRSCKVGFVLPLPTSKQLAALYHSVEYHEHDRATQNFETISDEEIRTAVAREHGFLRKYQRYVPMSGRVFDVGAGWGTLLAQLQEQGYECAGLELSDTAARFANEKLGLKVHNGPVEELDNALAEHGEVFDLIILRHTIEHFYKPSEVLRSVARSLSDTGKIIIEVPDYGSWDRRWLGSEWPAFGPYHLWYFSRASLTRLLHDCDLRPLYWHQFMSGAIKNQWIRRVLNRIGGPYVLSGRNIGVVVEKQ